MVTAAALIVAGTFFWLGHRGSEVSGPPELIRAPSDPYKIKPPNPGGLNISAESQTAFETSAGEDKDSQLDTSKLPANTVVKPAEESPKTNDHAGQDARSRSGRRGSRCSVRAQGQLAAPEA